MEEPTPDLEVKKVHRRSQLIGGDQKAETSQETGPWGDRIMAMAPEIAGDIRGHAEASKSKKLERDAGIRAQIHRDFGPQLRAMEHITFALEQHGLLMLERINAVPEDHHTPVRSSLTLIHSAATITFEEIRHLSEQGYWVGAAARWRGLHELAVTAGLIVEGGPSIAQRYLDHGLVVQTRRLHSYHERHGRGAVSREELDVRIHRARELEEKHAIHGARSRFREAYGWAIPLLPRSVAGDYPRPTFDRLEALAGYDERRLLVSSAHGLVHNDSGGVRTAVLMEEGYSLGPIPAFTKTVVQPTLESIIWLVAATHTCFEPTLDSDYARLLSMQGAGLIHLASNALHSLDASDAEQP